MGEIENVHFCESRPYGTLCSVNTVAGEPTLELVVCEQVPDYQRGTTVSASVPVRYCPWCGEDMLGGCACTVTDGTESELRHRVERLELELECERIENGRRRKRIMDWSYVVYSLAIELGVDHDMDDGPEELLAGIMEVVDGFRKPPKDARGVDIKVGDVLHLPGDNDSRVDVTGMVTVPTFYNGNVGRDVIMNRPDLYEIVGA